MKYSFKITGITPLIMHANNIEGRDLLDSYRKRVKGTSGDDRSPAWSWKTYLDYSDQTGNVCIPVENVLAMLLEAGKKVRVQGKETLKAYTQLINFDQIDFDLLVNGQPVQREDIEEIDGEFDTHSDAVRELGFRLFVKPVSIGTSKHVRVRPRFADWALSGEFEVDEDDAAVLTRDALEQLWNVGGRRIGLGDWRPSSKKPGRYGRFVAEVEALT